VHRDDGSIVRAEPILLRRVESHGSRPPSSLRPGNDPVEPYPPAYLTRYRVTA